MAKALPIQGQDTITEEKTGPAYVRFSLSQRIEHLILLISFTILGITGLVQKFSQAPLSIGLINVLGGIEGTRLIHRAAAVVLILVSIYHILAVIYRIYVLGSPINMLPSLEDFRHLFQDVLFYLGKRARKAYYGRYNYAEKAEYLAVVWGTLIMAITGFMMWNPIATTRWLPGEAVPAAKAAHGGEALLAVLAIILWHFYHVHIRHFNRSMFTGKMTKAEMEHEHPAELDMLERGLAGRRPPVETIKRRQRVYFPFALVASLIFGFGLVEFITLEETALITVPRGESAQAFVPITPTPTATALPTSTPLPQENLSGAVSWQAGIAKLMENRCGTCHIQGRFGGLSLATYQAILEGGQSGPAVVPNNPDNSTLVLIQLAGGHAGQLSQIELQQIIEWIKAGAPDN